MKRLLIVLFSLVYSVNGAWAEDLYGLSAISNGGKLYIYKNNVSKGTSVLLETVNSHLGYGATNTMIDTENGLFYAQASDTSYTVYDYVNDTYTRTPVQANNYTNFELPYGTITKGSEIISIGTDTDGNATTVVGSGTIVGSDGKTIIGAKDDADGNATTVVGASNIVDTEGKTIIETKADGSTHIGENSLVTIETGGKQQLYATDASGDQIDINIKSGSNLLINGTNVLSSISTNTTNITANTGNISTNTTNITANTGNISTNTTNITANTGKINTNTQDIHGSVALSSAMSALPNSSEDATSTCGMGTGFHKGLSAISAGCAMDFSTLTQNENLSPLFKRASVNLGTSAIMNSTGFSNFALRVGLTFKLGAKKSSGTDLSMDEDLQRYSTGTNTRIAELKKENDTLRAEMDALKSNQKNEMDALKSNQKNEMDALNAKLDALIASLNNG